MMSTGERVVEHDVSHDFPACKNEAAQARSYKVVQHFFTGTGKDTR